VSQRILQAAGTVLVAVAMTFPGCAGGAMSEHEVAAIIAETLAFTDAMNAGDARLAASFYTEDGVRVGAFGDAQQGREEIEAAYDRLLHRTMPGARLDQERGSVRMLTRELAIWEAGLQIVLPGGGPPLRGHAVQVMKKVGGRWLVLAGYPKLFPPPPADSPVSTLRMQAQVSGEGRPVALVGGGLTGWKSWEPHAERLATGRTVARLQLLNVQFGLEDRPLPDDYSVRMESEALAAGLDGIGWLEPVDLVAWSYGALITLDFALNHPERVRTLTLIEPPATWVLPDRGEGDPDVEALHSLSQTMDDAVTEADLERFVCGVALSPPGIRPQELPQWPVWLEHRRSLRSGMAPFDHSDRLERLRGFDPPALLVIGTGTTPFLRRIQDSLAVHLPRARTTEMPAGHAPHLVSMDRFLGELERFHANPGAALAEREEVPR
jgi:uncharacterized protein (TIGR02246 family)